jgi:hypothetical protein
MWLCSLSAKIVPFRQKLLFTKTGQRGTMISEAFQYPTRLGRMAMTLCGSFLCEIFAKILKISKNAYYSKKISHHKYLLNSQYLTFKVYNTNKTK